MTAPAAMVNSRYFGYEIGPIATVPESTAGALTSCWPVPQTSSTTSVMMSTRPKVSRTWYSGPRS